MMKLRGDICLDYLLDVMRSLTASISCSWEKGFAKNPLPVEIINSFISPEINIILFAKSGFNFLTSTPLLSD